MTIEIKEKGSDSFFREAVNIYLQYRAILKNHNCKIKDYFKSYTIFLIVGAVLFVAVLMEAIFLLGFEGYIIFALSITGLCTLIEAAGLLGAHSMFKRLKSNHRESLLTLDENGVELNIKGSYSIRIDWDSIAVVKVGSESLSFLAEKQTAALITVTRTYEEQIAPWLRINRPEVEIA